MSDLIESEVFSQQGNSILVVEGDEILSQEIKSLLSGMGYDVHTAINGKVALEVIERISKPSLILLEPETSVMNGWEFEKKLDQDFYYSSIPIILLLSHTIKTAGLHYKEIFTKPLHLDKLLPAIKHYFFRGIFSESEDFDFNYSPTKNL